MTMIKKRAVTYLLAFISLVTMGVSQASAASLERFLVTSAVGAGLGQAIGRNTESTLMGAAAAVLLDSYFQPQFLSDHPITDHLQGYRPTGYTATGHPICYRVTPEGYCIDDRRAAPATTVTTTTTTTSYDGSPPTAHRMRRHFRQHARRHRKAVQHNIRTEYENPRWW